MQSERKCERTVAMVFVRLVMRGVVGGLRHVAVLALTEKGDVAV